MLLGKWYVALLARRYLCIFCVNRQKYITFVRTMAGYYQLCMKECIMLSQGRKLLASACISVDGRKISNLSMPA